jgi:hypothetical protein
MWHFLHYTWHVVPCMWLWLVLITIVILATIYKFDGRSKPKEHVCPNYNSPWTPAYMNDGLVSTCMLSRGVGQCTCRWAVMCIDKAFINICHGHGQGAYVCALNVFFHPPDLCCLHWCRLVLYNISCVETIVVECVAAVAHSSSGCSR